MRNRVIVNGKTVNGESIHDGAWHEPEIGPRRFQIGENWAIATMDSVPT